MAVQIKLCKVEDPNDPSRCKAIISREQCPFIAISGSDYCEMHGNTAIQAKSEEALQIRNYRVAKWQATIGHFADNPQVKSLREEVGILRMLMEETLTKCNDASDLFMMSTKISDLSDRISRTVALCHKLEQSTGQTLDKTAALNFAAQIVEIIGRYVTMPDVIDKITSDMLEALKSITGAVRGVEEE